MGTAAAVAIAILAALLASAAILLATIANRRWVLATKGHRAALTTNTTAMDAAATGRRLADLQAQLESQEPALYAHDAAIRELQAEVAGLSTDLSDQGARSADLAANVRSLAAANTTSLRRVAIVRYDAFSDVGGRLSYSTAILDDTATGLVITSLAGKSDVRTYVKAVSGGVGQPALTPEEEQAVSAARGTTP